MPVLALGLPVPLACGDDEPSTGPQAGAPASISLSTKSHTSSALVDSIRLEATVRDGSGNVIPSAEIAWSSTDKSVVRVNSSGWVFAEANGSARVVASVGALADTASIEVAQTAAQPIR